VLPEGIREEQKQQLGGESSSRLKRFEPRTSAFIKKRRVRFGVLQKKDRGSDQLAEPRSKNAKKREKKGGGGYNGL